jgi:hypothetical protein
MLPDSLLGSCGVATRVKVLSEFTEDECVRLVPRDYGSFNLEPQDRA